MEQRPTDIAEALHVAKLVVKVLESMNRMRFTTLDDAYAEYTRGHGAEAPLRTPEELRSAVHVTVGEYSRIDDLFWEVLFASEWNWAPRGSDLRTHLTQLMDDWDAENYNYELEDDSEDSDD